MPNHVIVPLEVSLSAHGETDTLDLALAHLSACAILAVLVAQEQPKPYSAQPHPGMRRLPHRPYAYIEETPTRR
jgi:hypothetical protein